jgi:hypothetical protein
MSDKVHSCAHARAELPEWAQDPMYDGEPIFMILAEMEADREEWLAEQAELAAEEAEREFDADVRDRLRGRCDLCGQLPREREHLQIDGGLALCSGCSARGEDP